MKDYPIKKTDEQWRKALSPIEYEVSRHAATEAPFSGKFDNHFENGTYKCVCCGTALFASETKFNAGCGWPSFYDALDQKNVEERQDHSHGMVRVEVLCAHCGAHLGHVFNDGPQPTGQRYCINSASLKFTP